MRQSGRPGPVRAGFGATTIAQSSPAPRKRFALPPRGGKPRGPGQNPDEFDHWLDQTLRDLFAPRPGKDIPPAVKALLDIKARKGKPKPGKAKPE